MGALRIPRASEGVLSSYYLFEGSMFSTARSSLTKSDADTLLPVPGELKFLAKR
ncbi:hypothetical protein ACVW0W_001130 [Bradyrhizobium sp. USDA 4469]